MIEDKRVVEAQRDVAEARCQYCGRTFKSPRGLSIHERACKEKDRLDEATQSGQGQSEKSPTPEKASASQEAAEIEEGLAIPSPEDQKGGLKEDFRMSDASLVSDPSAEVRRLIAQMEKERQRWENEKRKFLEQTEGLFYDEGSYKANKTQKTVAKKGPDMEEVLLAEMKIAAELDDLRNELQKKVNIETMKDLVESGQEVSEQLTDLDENVEALTNVLGEFSARTLDDLSSLSKKLDVKADEGDLQSLKEFMKKLDGKLEDLVEEVGHQEALNVSKIPPRILELVYQTTLDDVTAALNATLGQRDTEEVIARTMEEVRVQTSGSEMFRYQYPRFKTIGIASSVEKGLVSARQVQMTYEEILKRLKEHVPRHNAKSFRAMIKVKSQEFAIERSTELAKEIRSMQDQVQALKEFISELSRSMREEMSTIATKLLEITGRIEDVEPDEDGKSEVEITDGFIPPEFPQEVQEEEETIPFEEIENKVLASIPDMGTSLTKMKKELDYREEDIQSGLDSLMEKGQITRKKRGKGYVYFLHDAEEGGSEDE